MSEVSNSLAAQRIAKLLDENSFMEIGSLVTSRSTDFNMTSDNTPSDGVITGHGLIDGNLVFVYSQDASVLGGTIGEMHARKIASVYDMAMKMGAPVIGLLDCAGVRLQESMDALDGLGQIIAKETEASGVVPQITAVFGSCGGGLAVVPALSDFSFMEEKGRLFVNAPNTIDGNRVEVCDTASASFQAEETGVVDGIGSEDDILAQIRELVTILPSNNGTGGLSDICEDDLNRACESMESMKGDAHYVISEIADDHVFVETKKDFAKGLVTGFIRLNGTTVGVVANNSQIHDETGALTDEFQTVFTHRGVDKATEHVSFCDAFEIPVLTITNVKGYKATRCTEKHMAKALARLTYAFANATVPKVNLIVGDAFGSAYVNMNSKAVGADLVYAWPQAKVSAMDAELAAKILYEGASAAELKEKAAEYDALQGSINAAARRGYVDRIVEPVDTRKYLIAAFEMLYTKSVAESFKKHGTK